MRLRMRMCMILISYAANAYMDSFFSPSSLIYLHISNVQTMVYGEHNTNMSHITESTFQFSK